MHSFIEHFLEQSKRGYTNLKLAERQTERQMTKRLTALWMK
jgi:hypothetical protein